MRSTVVASVMDRNADVAALAIREAPSGCALVELRADLLSVDELRGVVAASPRPLIVTVRRPADGGGFEGAEAERRRMLLAALEAGAAFVDVELGGAAADLADGEHAGRVILSDHGAACHMDALEPRFERMLRARAARLKLVPRAGAVDELAAVRRMLERSRREGRPLACFASGRAGLLSRLLAPSWGSWATYGAAAAGKATAEGQPTAAELLELHDVLDIGPQTRCFALVGASVGASPSPAMHGAAFRELGLDARYFALDLASFEEVLPWLGARGGLAGLAVTMPFKEQAARHGRPADELTRLAGAANTLLAGERGHRAFNTDGAAVLALVRRTLDPAGARVAVVGAGGTARAAAAVLRSAGAGVTLFNRTDARASALAAEIDVKARPFAALPGAAWDVLVQATPLGAAGEILPVGWNGRLVLDAVYGASPTPLVAEARRRGLVTVDGLELLVEQALLQFERLNGRRAERGTFTAAARRWLDAHSGSA